MQNLFWWKWVLYAWEKKEIIYILMASPLASFWNRGLRELRKGLLEHHLVNDRLSRWASIYFKTLQRWSERVARTCKCIRELKQQRNRGLRKLHVKSDVALLQTLSRLFSRVQVVKCWQLFLELNSKRLYQSTGMCWEYLIHWFPLWFFCLFVSGIIWENTRSLWIS